MGGPGTAKTSIINQFLGSFPAEEFTSKTITFSSLTTPAIFQTAVEVGGQSSPGRQSTCVTTNIHTDAASQQPMINLQGCPHCKACSIMSYTFLWTQLLIRCL